MSVLDDYLVDPRLSLLDKTRIQAQVLLPVLRALRSELGKEKADAIVKQALRDWSKQLFAAIGDGIEGSPRRKWAAVQSVWGEVSGREVEAQILRHDQEALEIDVTDGVARAALLMALERQGKTDELERCRRLFAGP